jgi:ATP synthase protein I
VRAIWAKKPAISRNEKIAVTKLLVRQLAITGCVALVLYAFLGKPAAISALFGGLLVWLPNVLMAMIIFNCNTYHDPQKIVRAFYIGEFFKLIMTGVLFVLVLHCVNVLLAPLLVGLISTYLAYIFV